MNEKKDQYQFINFLYSLLIYKFLLDFFFMLTLTFCVLLYNV